MNFFFLVFYAVIAVVGLYLLILGIRMKKSGKLPSVILSPEERWKLKDVASFIDELFPSTIILSVCAFGFSAVGFMNWFGVFGGLPAGTPRIITIVAIGIFLVAFAYFSRKLSSCRYKYLT